MLMTEKRGAGRHCILVVDDNEDTRTILRALLTHHGYEMRDAQSAEEMFETLEHTSPDLIVLDIRLPGMDGCQALAELRRQYKGPVFMFSEYYDLFAERIHGCTPDAFFPKSKGPVILVQGIQQKLSAIHPLT